MKNSLKNFALVVSVLFMACIAVSSCSSDDDEDKGKNPEITKKSPAEALEGQYLGTDTYPYPYLYEVTMTVQKVDDNTIRVTTDKGNVTPRNIKVDWNTDLSILGNNEQGVVVYDVKNQVLKVTTKNISEGNIQTFFEGKRISK